MRFEWWAWVDLTHRPRPYQGLLWCYMHSSVAMMTLLTTSLMVTSRHDCWFQVPGCPFRPEWRSLPTSRLVTYLDRDTEAFGQDELARSSSVQIKPLQSIVLSCERVPGTLQPSEFLGESSRPMAGHACLLLL